MLCGWLNLQCLLPLNRARSPDLKTVIQWSERVQTNGMADMYHTYLNEWTSNHNMKNNLRMQRLLCLFVPLLAFAVPTSGSLLVGHNEKLWQPTTWIILIVWFGSNKLRHIHIAHTQPAKTSRSDRLMVVALRCEIHFWKNASNLFIVRRILHFGPFFDSG